jgi:hypothetical protein
MEPAAEPPHHQRLEQLERAVQEIEALEAIYGFEPGGFTVHSEAELLAARTVLDDVAFSGGSAPAAAAAGASQQLEVELQISLDDVLNAPRARLRCRLPPGYPDTAASVSVSIAGLHRTAADGLSIKLSEKALALAGDEAVMELVQNLQELCSIRGCRVRLAPRHQQHRWRRSCCDTWRSDSAHRDGEAVDLGAPH